MRRDKRKLIVFDTIADIAMMQLHSYLITVCFSDRLSNNEKNYKFREALMLIK